MKHGCHNRAPFRDWHHAQDGYYMQTENDGTRLPRIVKVPNVMTRDCQYTKSSKNDPACTGCKHKE